MSLKDAGFLKKNWNKWAMGAKNLQLTLQNDLPLGTSQSKKGRKNSAPGIMNQFLLIESDKGAKFCIWLYTV